MLHYRSDPSLHNIEYLSEQEKSAIEVVKGNIEDAFFVRNCVSGCDYIFHLAALIPIPYSYVAPASFVSTNIIGTLNILESARYSDVTRIIHTSTSECYGNALYIPIDEKHRLQAQSPYSASKISADMLVESYYKSFSTPVVTIRPFNTYGPRQSSRAVIPTIISQLLVGTDKLEIGAISPIRDFTYVSDTVEGLILGALTDDVEGELINLGYGRGISIEDLAKIIMDLLGYSVPITSNEIRFRPEKSEVTKLVSDNSKAKKLIQWVPQVKLRDGLEMTNKFIKQNQKHFRVNQYEI